MKLDLRSVRLGVMCTVLALTSLGCVKTDNKADPAPPPPAAVTLVSIAVTPANTTVGVGGTQKYAATGTYSDNTTQDITSTVVWSVGDPSVATISNANTTDSTQGELTAVGLGTDMVTATYTVPDTVPATTVVGSTPVTVIAAKLMSLTLTIDSRLGKAPVKFITQLHATGNYSDKSTADLTESVTWMGLTPDIATVNDVPKTKGQLTGVTPGNAKVRAMQNDIIQDGAVVVTNTTLVTIAMTPPSTSLAANATLQFSCLGNFSDGEGINLTQQTDWASSDTSIVTVSNDADSKGFATGQAGLFPGTANVTATSGTIVGTSKVTRPLF